MKSPKLVAITRKMKKKINAQKEEDTNTVQAHLLVKTRKVYPKKLCMKKNKRDIDSGSAVQHTKKEG